MNPSVASAKQLNVLFFATYVSCASGASYALREAVKRVALVGVKGVVVIPDCPDSRSMFPDADFDVLYMPIARPRRSLNPWIQIHYLFSFLPTLFSLRRIIRQREIDLVHFNEITDVIAGIAAKWCRVRCVCHVRADGLPNPYRWLLVSLLKVTTDAIVVPSKSTEAWITSEAHSLTGRLRLIYDYAFDVSEYQTSVSGIAFRNEFAIPSDAILVLLVSKLVVPKGHLCLIRAAEKVLEKSRNIYFILVGGTVPGHEAAAAEITACADNLVPPPSLRIVDTRNDLPAAYSACDIAVHCPIYPDTYPTVVLLPMLVGKPVIGSNIGGIPEQIDHNETGILVPPDDPDALARAILDLAGDPAKRAALGLSAMRRIRNGLVPETQGRRLADLYIEVLSETRCHMLDESKELECG